MRLDEAALRRLILCVVEAEDRTVDYLGIILADHQTVLDLNRTYLAHDYLTDVLSFPLGETDEATGETEKTVERLRTTSLLGQALGDSRSIAAGSRALRSRESSGSARLRETARARRSSRGASSKKA